MNDWLAGILSDEAIPGDVGQAARLCLNELVANAIMHGYPDGREGRIAVSLERRGGALDITLEDDGTAFDPLSVPLAEAMTGLDDARIGGFGIKLFRESSHSARYERSGGRNILRFVCG